MYLPAMTWHEFQEAAKDDLVALQPLGSTEQHGSIGPLGTDFIIPHEMARRVEAQFPDKVVLLPTIPYGVCPSFESFAGSIDIGDEALATILTSVVRDLSRHGVKRFIFLNGHGGNTLPMERACAKAWDLGGLGAMLDWWKVARELKPEWGGGHGGGQEAAVSMAVRPDWVNKKKNFVPEKIVHLSDALKSTYGETTTFKGATVRIVRKADAYTATGTFGGGDDSCAKADPQWGKEIFEGVTAYCIDFVDEFLRVSLEKAHQSCIMK